jgi:hypothetical protein
MSKKRDNVIGLVTSIVDNILPEQGYEKFSSGYISIGEGFIGAGFMPVKLKMPRTMFLIKLNEIPQYESLKDVETKFGDEKLALIDYYCLGVHQYLLKNLNEYKELDYDDPRLS